MIGKLLHFYIVCCVCSILYAWIGNEFTFDSAAMGIGIVLLVVFWAPVNTVYVAIIHFLKINTKILGNVYFEIVVSLLPLLLNTCYFYIAYQLTDDYFVMSDDGKDMSRKWLFNSTYIDIIIYLLLLIILAIHGRMKKKDDAF